MYLYRQHYCFSKRGLRHISQFLQKYKKLDHNPTVPYEINPIRGTHLLKS